MKRAIIIAAAAILLASTIWSGAQMFAQLFGATGTPIPALAWYKGDGNALDAMGNHDGEWVGTEAYADGPTGQAFDFNGSSYINCGNVGIGDEFTVSLWVKGGEQPSSYRRLISKGPDSETGSWQVQGSSIFGVRVDSSEQFNVTYNVGNLLTEEWVHLSLVFSKANSTIQVFLGGGLSRVHTVKYGTGITNDSPLTIASNAGGANPFLGKISDVRIFDRALSQANIQRIMESQDNEPLEELQ